MADERPILEYKIFPTAVLNAVEGKLRTKLLNMVQPGGVPRCLLAFVSSNNVFEFRWGLKTDKDWDILTGRLDQGMLGAALASSTHETWRRGDDNKPFRQGDRRTVYEIARRIEFDGKPTAVLLIDYFDTELDIESLDMEQLPSRRQIETWREEITNVLWESEQEAKRLILEIEEEVKYVVDHTQSLRGYAAIKRWDGRIRYFTYGEGKEKFKPYNQLEGICGDVMLKGKFQNVGNVWSHERYRSSDNEIKSEAVAPIFVNDECVGVLNMESAKTNHFSPDFETIIKNSAVELKDLARKFREPVGLEIGDHTRLLSDLIEQFSVPDDGLPHTSEASSIWDWAITLCQRKIRSLRDDIEADPNSVTVHSYASSTLPQSRQQSSSTDDIDDFNYYEIEGRWFGEFSLTIDGFKEASVVVKFKAHPQRAVLEIISQFCRLTANEIRRRRIEARGAEFERFVASVKSVCHQKAAEVTEAKKISLDDAFLVEMPHVVRRIMHCDHVTYFKVFSRPDIDEPILRLWQSTSDTIHYNRADHFYLAHPDDGLTGSAACQSEVLIVKNLRTVKKIAVNGQRLNWKQKVLEQTATEFRSFFAVPLRVDGRLVGLMRGHRTVNFSNIAFSEAERERLQSIQFLLQEMLSLSKLYSSEEEGTCEVRQVPA